MQVAKYGFYIPHERVMYTGEVEDPITGEITTPPSMTKQSFAAECDIHNILKQFKATGQISHMRNNAQQGRYLDLPADVDFQEALNVVMRAEAAFDTLPAKVRDRFGNDPELFLAFMSDPANQDEIIAMGLATDTRQPPTSSTGELVLEDGPPAPPPKTGVQG